jgi:AP-2 complex subunit mu-1
VEVSRLSILLDDKVLRGVDRIPRLQGGQEATFSGLAQLTSTTTRQVWARPPIDVDFQVLMFTASGLIVRFLKVFEKSDYTAVKWVRYLTKASGSYQIRVCVFFMEDLERD